MFARFDGQVIDRGDYITVLTPNNPGYYWGNFLLFSQPPGPDDLSRWEALFDREIPTAQDFTHYNFGWDAPRGERGAAGVFQEAGYELISNQALSIEAPGPRCPAPPGITIRVVSPDEWPQVVSLNRAVDPLDGQDDSYALFKERLRERYRRMIDADRGIWLGAFAGDQLVAQLGLYFEGPLGRFQSVETHESFRRRGICAALVARAVHIGLEERGARQLIIVTEPDSTAERVYRRVGFRPLERQMGLSRIP